MCLYLVFTTHPVVCIQIFGLGMIIDVTDVMLLDLQTLIVYNSFIRVCTPPPPPPPFCHVLGIYYT